MCPRGLHLWYGVEQIKYVFADKENSETSFRTPVYYLKWFHFFNKTEFQQYYLSKPKMSILQLIYTGKHDLAIIRAESEVCSLVN